MLAHVITSPPIDDLPVIDHEYDINRGIEERLSVVQDALDVHRDGDLLDILDKDLNLREEPDCSPQSSWHRRMFVQDVRF